jgi:hypothetical protein
VFSKHHCDLAQALPILSLRNEKKQTAAGR